MHSIYSHSLKALDIAYITIKNGGLIVYPTDTLYGFGGDARDKTVINKINSIKKRTGPITVLASDIDMALDIVDLKEKEKEKFLKKIIGGNTVIVPAKSNILCYKILGDKSTIGIRIPNHKFGVKLVKKLGFPITTTSVNQTGEMPLNDPKKIIKKFGSKIDLLVDEGILPNSIGSTIFKLTDSGYKRIR